MLWDTQRCTPCLKKTVLEGVPILRCVCIWKVGFVAFEVLVITSALLFSISFYITFRTRAIESLCKNKLDSLANFRYPSIFVGVFCVGVGVCKCVVGVWGVCVGVWGVGVGVCVCVYCCFVLVLFCFCLFVLLCFVLFVCLFVFFFFSLFCFVLFFVHYS